MMENKVNTLQTAKKPKQKSDNRISKANYSFDIYHDKWQLDANKSLNFKLLASLNLSPKFESCFRLALADYASEFSSSYATLIFNNIRNLFAVGVKSKIKEEDIINYKALLDKSNEYKLGCIRAFLLDWYDKEIPGIDKKAINHLSSLKLSGNKKGKAVALGCPFSGAYSFDEQVDFIHWYVDAYTNGVISITDYAFIMGLQQTGARPIQLTRLYFGDLITKVEEGLQQFDLQIPNAKKRDEYFRDSLQTKEDVGEDLFLVLNAQAEHSINIIEEKFDLALTSEQKQEIPIFLNISYVSKLEKFSQFQKVQANTPDLLCMKKSGGFATILNRVARLCPLKTSRIIIDGEAGDLHINARRFRYTHATNMAMLGASNHTIAEELGHSDTQQVAVYTEFNEEMAERIDDALASDLTPLAQAFSGTLIDSEKDATRANDPRSRINKDGDTVGSCGKFGFCANGAVHCYTCNKFEPWLNAPHDEVLKSVLSERDRKRRMGASKFVLQGNNRSIKAIKAVIKKCEDRKQELAKEGDLNV